MSRILDPQKLRFVGQTWRPAAHPPIGRLAELDRTPAAAAFFKTDRRQEFELVGGQMSKESASANDHASVGQHIFRPRPRSGIDEKTSGHYVKAYEHEWNTP
ncbi:hypothetical protein GGE16_001670 [Rhizobium leguminosarum]|uniref:Uncharacterized protein n=1 Tax=Rhizobium leguminosarum TaxID=384 RepID=A0AAE2SVJ3_RHILE|nr:MULTISPECIES: hypothetical protein [Rhizobium]MBB4289630.1 hypothetical protein [Rhizobium leguminosarum]MBB4296274.1 hypothetical protein [Rhizobium leguminosarum]MBB4308466.1 hypothetical protein [Rhizobium leguminosarum]MBB4416302.1 hypothetical protein [Rhizobium leguminosarum]MBB4430731.1 hypothetical protein [Rhizobium esperanzae]